LDKKRRYLWSANALPCTWYSPAIAVNWTGSISTNLQYVIPLWVVKVSLSADSFVCVRALLLCRESRVKSWPPFGVKRVDRQPFRCSPVSHTQRCLGVIPLCPRAAYQRLDPAGVERRYVASSTRAPRNRHQRRTRDASNTPCLANRAVVTAQTFFLFENTAIH
jgi:hypothetical protein